MSEGQYLITYLCWACGGSAMACPDCVVSVLIDPETELPPDLARGEDGVTVHVQPTPEALARAVGQPICDDCVILRNIIHKRRSPWLTGAERHRNHLAGAII